MKLHLSSPCYNC